YNFASSAWHYQQRFIMKSLCLLFLSMNIVFTAAGIQAAGVTMQDNGGSVVLGNSIVSVEISKKDGNVVSLEYQKKPLLAQPAYLDWHTDKDNHIGNGEFSIRADPTTNGGEMAEVVIIRKYPGSGDSAYDIALHHVLRRGDSGFYSYAVFSHSTSYPRTGLG